MSTVNDAALASVPVIFIDPVTLFVSPTAVLLCPNSVSVTRYRTTEPLPTVQVPARGLRGLDAAFVGTGVVSSDSFGGAGFSMKWK